MGSIPRSVSANNFFLELDGTKGGYLKSAEGGDITADVVVEQVGPEQFAKKHIAGVKYEEFVLGVDLGTDGGALDWVAEVWAGQPTRRNGAVVEVDHRSAERARREFRNALITETTVPALDAGAKAPAPFLVRVAPESITHKKGGGGRVAAPAPTKQKTWLPSNFRFELDGVDTKKVSKIDAFTVKQTIPADDVGVMRAVEREPSRIEFPNLRVTLAESSAQTWNDWLEDFVVRGNNGDDREKKGAIVLLDATLKQELARIELVNVGIFALRRQTRADEQIARLTAELYVESMKLTRARTEVAQPEPELAHVGPN